jgi:pimeloyl-ACP methyl ester carboxylesterase
LIDVLVFAVKVFVVGHDWGAIVAWSLCLLRPDRVRALVNLSVAFMPRRPGVKPVDYFRAVYGDDYYVCRFQVSSFLLYYHGLAHLIEDQPRSLPGIGKITGNSIE